MSIEPTQSNPVFQSGADRIRYILDDFDLFFIVGCEKSGTTWVQHLLNGHPEICCRGESRFGPIYMPLLAQTINNYNQQQSIGPENTVSNQDFDYLVVSTLALLMSHWLESPEAQNSPVPIRVLGEKSPGHAKGIATLARLFPKAKFIHIVRDGRDGAVSGWFHNQRKSRLPDFNKRFPTFRDYVEYFVRYHWLEYIKHSAAFGRSCPERYFELRYEDLKSEPTGLIRSMLEFLKVSSDTKAITQCEEAGSFGKLAGGRKPGQEDAGSHFRKGITGDWKNHFDEASLQTFMQYGGSLLEHYGYETTSTPVTEAGAVPCRSST